MKTMELQSRRLLRHCSYDTSIYSRSYATLNPLVRLKQRSTMHDAALYLIGFSATACSISCISDVQLHQVLSCIQESAFLTLQCHAKYPAK